ncbi:hypothetical protein NQ317_012742 [Molorchus minor]|uniref:Uncharacterized protein n=1 Tax=Molorchus minor TaxID=1323400 RepID=A0ABQ9K1X2_9CUCU|nr:hypothetical protein NQ317_012742 [Molorchus minor]
MPFDIDPGTIAWMILETIKHIIVRIRHVKELFADAIMEKNVQSRREKFNYVVKYHAVVLNGVVYLDASPYFVGLKFGNRKIDSSLFVCMGWGWVLFMHCVSGQLLQNEVSETVSCKYPVIFVVFDMATSFVESINGYRDI